MQNRVLSPLYLTFIMLVAIIVLVTTGAALASGHKSIDPLQSWNEGKAKQSILDFVQATTAKKSPYFIPLSERIATFDQDGTTWVEKPIYSQAMFAFDQVKILGATHPEWKTEEPFAAILSGDLASIEKFTIQDMEKIVAVTHSGMTVEQFDQTIKQWLSTATHPRFKKLYTQLVYQPMLEAMNYLRDNGYQTYIVTGGGQEFVRAYSEKIYGVQPQQIIGSAGKTKYSYGPDGKPQLVKLPEILFVDDSTGKPSAISLVIGRRPHAAFGNSTGDRQMLEWTKAGGGKRLAMLVHHDDDKREYAYGSQSKIGTFTDELNSEADQNGWIVISMKDDWKTIFPVQKE